MNLQQNRTVLTRINSILSLVITASTRTRLVAKNLALLCSFFVLSFISVVNADTLPSDDALDAMFKAQDYDSIVDTLEPLPSKTVKQYNLLISALMNTDLDDAEEVAIQFINDHKGNYRAYHMHASVMGAQATSSIFSALGYAKKAKASLEKAVEIAPDEIDVYQALMQFYIMAPSIAGGDIDEAKKLADKITQMDALEGKFATAKVYAADDKKTEAKVILNALSEQPEFETRSRYELGQLLINEEEYDDAIAALTPLISTNIEKAEKSDEQAWDTYSNNKFTQLYGTYRVGWIAVETSEYTDSGINALTLYLTELNTTDINTQQLPSKNWANLRLAELYLNADDVSMASSTIAKITEDDDKRLTKTLKSLKKQIKKRT
ncbi:hypothetical protein Q4561_06350 [Alteromonas sp. 1_MG-2023]|uniref:tetratricopeptide repeat protein n=1 Tax=Alteromonas sp. 1_MG-2023 TaxID=3062669 RepID=UPI0026E40313|nr:hypothetical protein [Alteromonas sp. 1_MG-2023]MDO6566673.1 hypothetical protein [Alteromonas sp. 1_MG-2023]